MFIISAERPGPAFLPSNSCSHNCQITKQQTISLLSLQKNTSLLSAAALSRRTNKNKLRYSLQMPGRKESGTVVASNYRQRKQPPTASGVPPRLSAPFTSLPKNHHKNLPLPSSCRLGHTAGQGRGQRPTALLPPSQRIEELCCLSGVSATHPRWNGPDAPTHMVEACTSISQRCF